MGKKTIENHMESIAAQLCQTLLVCFNQDW